MSEVTTKVISELRTKTEGAVGLMDCKKVLEETGGDIDKAIKLLRERGLLVEAKDAYIKTRTPITANIVFSQITPSEMSTFGKKSEGLYRYKGNAPSVEIPFYITDIALGAFKNSTALKHVIIPGGIRKLLPVFQGCTSLEIVEMQEGVIEIGPDAFWLLSSLKKVVIPKSVQTISDSAFFTIDYIKTIVDARAVSKNSNSLAIKLQAGALFAFEKLLSLHKHTFKKYYVKSFEELIDSPQFIKDCRELRQNLTIYGESGSVAESYAVERGLRFEDMGTMTSTSSELNA